MNKKSMKEYRVWRAMKARCYSPSQNKGYYKQDHIGVCDRWMNSFNNFISDMGMMPDDSYSIERVDVHKGYEPDNCIWIPQRDQSKNRRNSRMVCINGRTACLKDWARCFGLKYTTVIARIDRYGYSVKDALEIPNDLKAVDVAIRDYYGMGVEK